MKFELYPIYVPMILTRFTYVGISKTLSPTPLLLQTLRTVNVLMPRPPAVLSKKMSTPPDPIPVTNPDWVTVATNVLLLLHVPVPGLVVPSDIVTVAVICSVWPTTIVELGEVTLTETIVGIVVVVVDVVDVVDVVVVTVDVVAVEVVVVAGMVVVVGVVGVPLHPARNKIKRESAVPKHRFIIPSQ